MKKKRKKVTMKVTHSDEQTEGALMESVKLMKPYTHQGVMIVMTKDSNWKILAFGSNYSQETFKDILFECLNAGALSFFDNKSDIDNWDI